MRRLFVNIGCLAGIVPAGVLRKEGADMDCVGQLADAVHVGALLAEHPGRDDTGQTADVDKQAAHLTSIRFPG